MVLILVVLLILAGWILFSLAAGIIVYLSALTTNHAALEPKKMTKAESRSALVAHTNDRKMMDPLNEAKARWEENRVKHLFDELTIRAFDGLRLTGFYWKAKKAAGENTVILIHGMMDSSAGMGYLAERYHELGWNVLSIDQRSHGESEGTKRTMGINEAKDISAWVEEIVVLYSATRIYIHGVSMGAAATLFYAARSDGVPSVVRGVIADSSYASYVFIFKKLLYQAIRNRFIVWSITLGASLGCFIYTGIRFQSIRPDKSIQKIQIPVLLFHGQQDLLVPVSSIRKMFAEAMKLGAETVVVPGAPHIGSYFYSPDLYMRKIIELSTRSESK